MKRSKKLIVLVAVLVVLSVITLIASQTKQKQEDIQATGETILSVDGDSVDAIAWSYEDTSLSYHKTDDTWTWDDDSAFPVDADVMSDLISVFTDFHAAFIIEEPDSLSAYGLDDPTCTITLSAGDTDYTITLGDESTMDSERYVSIGDGNVYLVATDPFTTYNITLEDTIKQDEIPSFDTITEMSFSGDATETVRYEEDNTAATYCAEDVYFTTIKGSDAPLDTDRVEDYLSALKYLSLTDYVTYNATSEELATYGMDDPQLGITLTYTDSDTDAEASFTLYLSQNPTELAAKEEAEAAGNTYDGTVTAYARLGDSPIIYTIDSSSYDELIAATYNDLRHTDVISASFADITQMDIAVDGTNYTLSSDDESVDSAEDRTFTYNDEEVDTEELQGKISSLSITEFSSEVPTGKEEIRITFQLANENYPQIQMEIYRYDGTSCLVVVDGETIGLVSRSSVVDLVEAVNAIVLS